MNAVKFEFPNASINGCFSFITMCMASHVQETGLQKKNIWEIQILHYTYECYQLWHNNMYQQIKLLMHLINF